jgi:hypothetical protein
VVEVLGKRGARVADAKGDKIHPFPVSFEGRDEGGGYLSVFFSLLMSQSKSLHKPISTMMRVHSFFSKGV